VGNVAQDAIGAQDSAIVLYDDAGRHPLPRAPKLEQARALVRHIAGMYNGVR
jgi:phosphopantothenoylcysteine decarboxylase/phosphopantothenate--cysteine ligase